MIKKMYDMMIEERSSVAMSKISTAKLDEVLDALQFHETGYDERSYTPLLLKQDDDATFWHVLLHVCFPSFHASRVCSFVNVHGV